MTSLETDIRYVRSGGVAIAYQVVGDGDTDLVDVPDFMSNLVYAWKIRAGENSIACSQARSG